MNDTLISYLFCSLDSLLKVHNALTEIRKRGNCHYERHSLIIFYYKNKLAQRTVPFYFFCFMYYEDNVKTTILHIDSKFKYIQLICLYSNMIQLNRFSKCGISPKSLKRHYLYRNETITGRALRYISVLLL